MTNKSLHCKRLIVPLIVCFSVSFVYLITFAQSSHPVRAENGMVVSSDPIASNVGVNILKNGGNAVDAAVATAFTMAVTLPGAGNISGGGFLVYHGNDGTVTTIDFREKAPLAASKTMFLDEIGKLRKNANHEGLLSVGVPGTVAGLALAHDRLGKLSWEELIEPAIRLAEEGFPVNRSLHQSMKSNREHFAKYPSTARIFLKADGNPYEPDDIWKQPDLAATLKRIQDRGKEGFYQGKTAELLVKYMRENGGIITQKDLDQYEAVERKPVYGSYRGYDVITMAPPSSGGVVLIEMLNILEGFDLKEMGHNSAQYLHVLTETMRYAYADRARFLGDPEFNPDMPVNKLISKDHSETIRKGIDLEHASKSSISDVDETNESEQTTHFSVVDGDGNCVSFTYTLEAWFGSKIVVEGAGFLLNNEMGDFNPVPGRTDDQGLIGTKPNWVAPGKRMLSSMTPTILAKAGKPVLVVGTPGGRTIINGVLQVILNFVDHEMNIAESIAAGRIHHQWLPDVTLIEERATTLDSQRLYEKMGHRILIVTGLHDMMGIHLDHKNNVFLGAADPRDPDGAVVGF